MLTTSLLGPVIRAHDIVSGLCCCLVTGLLKMFKQLCTFTLGVRNPLDAHLCCRSVFMQKSKAVNGAMAQVHGGCHTIEVGRTTMYSLTVGTAMAVMIVVPDACDWHQDAAL